MSEKLSLKYESASGASRDQVLQSIAIAVEELGQREAWSDGLVFKVNLVLEEVGINILSYGGANGETWPEFEIVIISEDESLTIEVLDEGRPFDPLADAPLPSIDAALEDRAIGGLGIHLVKTMMDDTFYEHSGGRNRLTMMARRD